MIQHNMEGITCNIQIKQNEKIYIIGLINTILCTKVKLCESTYLNNIINHFENIKREINRGDIFNYYNKNFAIDRIDKFIKILYSDTQYINSLPIDIEVINNFIYLVNEIIEILNSQKIILTLIKED